MQALILAAGMGKRLGSYTKDVTKCMVKVNGKALIDYAIDALIKADIKRLILVVGYQGQKLIDYINTTYPPEKRNGLEFCFIKNSVYDTTNNIYSLYLARNEFKKDDTILLESDIIFDPEVISDVLQNPDPNLAVVSLFESWMDGTCTLIDDEKHIIALLDKAHFEWSKINNYYKTVNIYKFSKQFITTYYIPFLEAYQKAFGKNEYYEAVLKVLAYLDAHSLKAHVVRADRWYEIDDPADLAVAENRFAPATGKLQLMEARYGGYWRFPQIKDFCYLVNPFFPPPKMVEEIKSSFTTLLCSYPSGAKQQSLLASKIFNVSPNHIVVGNGAAELIGSLGKFITGITAISYPTFNEYPAQFSNSKTVKIPVEKGSYSYSVDDIISTVKKEKANTVLLINPDNPTGHYFDKESMMSLLAQLKTLHARLVFDESFGDFAINSKRFSLIDEDIISEYPDLIVIKSLSKSYGIPGLRLGVLVCHDEKFINDIAKENTIWNINSFAEYFLQIFDKYKKSYLLSCDKIADERIRFSANLSALPQVFVYSSQANYLLCRLDGKITASELAVRLLQKHNIFIKDLTPKEGFEGGQYIRVAVLAPQDNDQLVSALKEELQ